MCTSDWHMGVFGDPSDAVKLHNDQLLDLLSRWESEYDLIIFNGDILEVLKSSRIKFSHKDQTNRVLEDRLPVVEKIRSLKNCHWVVGNHDYPLEEILNLPRAVVIPLDNDYMLCAEHGHLLRAPIEHYSDYAWHFHLMYCLSWWVDKIGMTVFGNRFCLDAKIAQYLSSWRTDSADKSLCGKLKSGFVKLAFSYASLHSDNSYSSLGEIFLNCAQQRFKSSNTLVTFGHSHQRVVKYFPDNNIYLNTGNFSVENNYSVSVFSTDDASVRMVENCH